MSVQTFTSVPNEHAERAFIEEVRLQEVSAAAELDPKALIAEMRGFDPTLQEHFGFSMYPANDDPLWPFPEARCVDGWLWQADVIDWWHDPSTRVSLILKARQLGITWLAVAYGLWLLLYRPGSFVVAYSYDQEQSKKLIGRAWSMFTSIPAQIRAHLEILTPNRAEFPTEWIRVRDRATGKISAMQALPATRRAGQGDTVTFGIMDEAARMDYARDIYTSIVPATSRIGKDGRSGKLALVSTANGLSNPGALDPANAGNFFHYLYANRDERNISFRFLSWRSHPERDQHWYDTVAMELPSVERHQQFPDNEADAFMLSDSLYFHEDDVKWYAAHVAKPTLKGMFSQNEVSKARWIPLDKGAIEIYVRPRNDAKYGMGADVATGHGNDFSSAHVIDFGTGEIVAHIRCKMTEPDFADQLYWLGRWYNWALIAPEKGGGYGTALVYSLRSPRPGRPAYPYLYRHQDNARGDRPLSESYGFPMNQATRAHALEYLSSTFRDRTIHSLPVSTAHEVSTFVHKDSRPSPRAQDGNNDDTVMSLAITMQLWERYGDAPAPRVSEARRIRTRQQYRPHPARAQ